MRGMLLAGMGAIALIGVLGCGGVWDEAMVEALGEQLDELDGKLNGVAESPNKDRVRALISQARIDRLDNKLGIIEFATFTAAFEESISDGMIDEDEVLRLEKKYASIAAN